MKAIKKRIRRKYFIPTKDILIITAKDNTQRLAKAGEDVIITEDDGSQYSMSRTTFDKKYDIIDTEFCISKANEIDFVLNTTDKNILFPASWGEQTTAFPGAAIVLENGTFGYAIQAKEFEETYDIVDEKIRSMAYSSIWYLPNPDDFIKLDDDTNKDTDYFQGVVAEYLRADRGVFVNPEILLQLGKH